MTIINAGPTSRLSMEKALELSAREWAWQLKLDGVYAQIETDTAGCVAVIKSRRNAPHWPADVGDLIGLPTGLPDAVIMGELEAQTECAIRLRSARGYPLLHLFDLATWRGCDVTREPYSSRYGLLHRWQSAAELGEVPRVDWWRTDSNGDAHDILGRYTRPVPADLRRLPIVPLHRGKGAAELLWHEVERSDAEGMVAVRLDAPMGARAAKLKVKRHVDLDCTVLAVDRTGAILSWAGKIFAVSRSAKWQLTAGMIVTVLADGFYADGIPRFARLSRIRTDLAPLSTGTVDASTRIH